MLKQNYQRDRSVNLQALRQIWRFIRPYQGDLIIALIGMAVGTGAMLGMVQGVRLLVDHAFGQQDTAGFERALMLLLVLVLLMVVSMYVRVVRFRMVGERAVADLRQSVFNHLLRLDAGYFETRRVGELVARLTADAAIMQQTLELALPIAIRSTLQLVGGMALLLVTSFKLTGLVLLTVLVIMVLAIAFGRRVRTYGRDMQQQIADVGAHIEQVIGGIRVVQGYVQEMREQEAFRTIIKRQMDLAWAYNRARGVFFSIVILSIFGAITAVLWYGGMAVMHGQMSPGTLLSFMVYSIFVALGAGSLVEVWSSVQAAAGASERMLDVLSAESNIADPVTPKSLPTATNGRHLVLDKVNFCYPSRPEQAALSNVSFTAEPGQMVAVVGPSGAGKSTLFQLLLRVYDPQHGCLSIDSIPIQDLALSQLRQEIGLVAQDVNLFNMTVADNIRYGRPEATDEEVMNAAKLAQAHDFIMELPDGYETLVGERGVRLSGGQRQRVAIARTVLCAPPVLLLDEATSHLDAESEQKFQQALEVVMQNRTTLVIAHRLATVQAAAKIIVMDGGKVVASGTHQELLKQSPIYKRLAELQFVTAAIDAA